jgi:flagellar biosynthesis protein FlhG
MPVNIEQLQNIRDTHTPIIAFASGKGGVGKTGICLNTAAILAQKGHRILVFDGDLGLGNVDVQLGLAPEKDLSDVINGTATLPEIITKTEYGFNVIPGRSGSEKLPFLDALERRDMLNEIRNISSMYDAVFLDVAAGVNDEVLGFSNFADFTVLVVTPDPSSITDAYAVIKLLNNKYAKNSCEVLVNQSGGEIEGKKTYEKLHTAAETFLGIQIPLLGVIPEDRQYAVAVKMQEMALKVFPGCKAIQRLEKVALNLLKQQKDRAA